MTYQSWMDAVPKEIKDDALWQMKVYQLGLFAADLAWPDVTKLIKDKRTIALADQLFRVAGSVSSDIAEGYSRKSGKDQARYYEYALGSAREATNWTYQARHILGPVVTAHRIGLWTEVIKLLLTIAPAERGYKMQEEEVKCDAMPSALRELLEKVPLPE